MSVPQVGNVHALRTRRSGPTKLIQLHVGLPDNLTLVEAHALSDQVEARLQSAFPEADIIIHQDPISLGDDGAGRGRTPQREGTGGI
jgi:ferrous-iron efflux pump FieF